MFYINYEECKLTVTNIGVRFSTTFYINYEECKFFINPQSFIFNISFILTMRNVNRIVYKFL